MGTSRPPHAPEFIEQMVEMVQAGRSPKALAKEFELSSQTIRK